jgi:plastocyanin
MIRRLLTAALTLSLFVAVAPDAQAQDGDPAVIIVKMIDKSPTEFAFEPADITAKPGDVIRFVQTTVTPHNVEFKNPPSGSDLAAIMMGPFLTQVDETYEIQGDQRFVAGTYEFVCTPHFMMGMTGTLTIDAANDR